MRRATQRRAIPEMPLQIRAARPVRASVQKNRPSFPPVHPSRRFFPPPISFFFHFPLPRLFGPLLRGGTRVPHFFFLPPRDRTISLVRDV